MALVEQDLEGFVPEMEGTADKRAAKREAAKRFAENKRRSKMKHEKLQRLWKKN